jgi:hypothetical protein
MASAFWGGFADSLKGSIDKDEEEKREERKLRLAEQLKLEYIGKLVDSSQTSIEGDFEVKRNAQGEVLSRTQLSPERLQEIKNERKRQEAETEGAIADAGVKKKGLEYFDQDRQAEREDKALGRRLQQAGVSIAQARFDYDKSQDEQEQAMEDEQLINDARKMLRAVGDVPAGLDNSVESRSAILENALEEALAAGDKAGARRIANEIQGELEMPYLKARTQATNVPNTPYLETPAGLRAVPKPGG